MIDLRSDTVTLPTPEMLDAMRRAELGDDSRDGDPTVRRLEALAAARLGKEAALFLPSGTMANLCAALTHTGRGSEILLDAGAHVLAYESGGLAVLGGVFHRALPAYRGAVNLEALERAFGTGLAEKRLAPALVWMETSHNNAGGAVLPLDHMVAVHAAARRHGAVVHLDGARLFNAAVALNVAAEHIVSYADSVCFCISKGLSAPVGSLLAGSGEFVARARQFRRMLGGNMRQSGVLAAAGIVALETMVERLTEDHEHAKLLARGLEAVDPRLIDAASVETNIVRAEVGASGVPAAQWAEDLAVEGVRAGAYGDGQLRFVTHRHIGRAEVERAVAAVGRLWTRYRAGAAGEDRGL